MLFKLVGLRRLNISVVIMLGLMPVGVQSATALPPPEDPPEEILRTEIITQARSPIDGKPLTAAEYAQTQAQLQNRPVARQLNPQIRQAVTLLRLRKIIRTIFPFLRI